MVNTKSLTFNWIECIKQEDWTGKDSVYITIGLQDKDDGDITWQELSGDNGERLIFRMDEDVKDNNGNHAKIGINKTVSLSNNGNLYIQLKEEDCEGDDDLGCIRYKDWVFASGTEVCEYTEDDAHYKLEISF